MIPDRASGLLSDSFGAGGAPGVARTDTQPDMCDGAEVFEALVPLLRRGLDADGAAILLQDEQGHWIAVGCVDVPDAAGLVAALSAATRTLQDRTLLVADLAARPELAAILPALDGAPAGAMACLSIVDADEVPRGALLALHRSPGHDEARARGVLAEMADSVLRVLALHDRAEERRQMIVLGPYMNFTTSAGGRVIEIADSLRRLVGVRPQDDVHDFLTRLVHPDDVAGARLAWQRMLARGTQTDIEFRMHVGEAGYRWFRCHAKSRRDVHGRVTRWCGLIEDVHERRTNQMRLAHLAYRDVLTGLSNRAHFRIVLEEKLAGAGRGRPFALLRLELHDFRAMNDTFGHAVGDRLLIEVANRVGACIRQTDLLAHEGGDEFFLLLDGIDQPVDVTLLVERILRALTTPMMADGSILSISAAIGVTLCPGDGADADKLLQNADLALLRARSAGRGGCCFFSAEMDERVRLSQALKVDLADALDRNQFFLVYQPVLSGNGNVVRGLEALLRWNHPTRGLVSPADFIPEAESNGLIVPIGQWVLDQACRDAMLWREPLTVAVNLSAAQFRHHGLVGAVRTALSGSGLPANRLVLEITESVPLLGDKETLSVLQALRGLGVQIALDDFGTGYASLSYLLGFAFDAIKIERSFVARIADGEEARTILRAVIRLSQALGIESIAEGVETPEQQRFLQQEGCGGLQGFLFSRPIEGALVPHVLERLGEAVQLRIGRTEPPSGQERAAEDRTGLGTALV